MVLERYTKITSTLLSARENPITRGNPFFPFTGFTRQRECKTNKKRGSPNRVENEITMSNVLAEEIQLTMRHTRDLEREKKTNKAKRGQFCLYEDKRRIKRSAKVMANDIFSC